jgi:copper chaperone CopZ
MIRRTHLVVMVLTLALASLASFAGEQPPAVHETAVFQVPDLAAGTVVTDIAKALSKEKGVVAAKADLDQALFKVTFEPGQTNPDALLKIMTSVSADAKLKEVVAAQGGATVHSGCGACPNKSACSSKKK